MNRFRKKIIPDVELTRKGDNPPIKKFKTNMITIKFVGTITALILAFVIFDLTDNFRVINDSLDNFQVIHFLSPPKLLTYQEHGECTIVTPVFANRTPTALASHPGSGNTMTRVLIEALTGVWTGSTHGNPRMLGKQRRSVGNPADDRLTENVVVVKTHQPGHRKVLRWTDARRAVLLIRDPLKSIPSAANAKWEVRNGVVMHTDQQPETDWISFRDRKFDHQLEMWRYMIEFWTSRFKDPKKLLIVIYEELVNSEKGPIVASSIMKFLGQGIVPPKKVPCIWWEVVRGSAEKVHRPNKYIPLFKKQQISQIIGNLTEISQSFKNEPIISRAMTLYLENAKNHKLRNE